MVRVAHRDASPGEKAVDAGEVHGGAGVLGEGRGVEVAGEDERRAPSQVLQLAREEERLEQLQVRIAWVPEQVRGGDAELPGAGACLAAAEAESHRQVQLLLELAPEGRRHALGSAPRLLGEVPRQGVAQAEVVRGFHLEPRLADEGGASVAGREVVVAQLRGALEVLAEHALQGRQARLVHLLQAGHVGVKALHGLRGLGKPVPSPGRTRRSDPAGLEEPRGPEAVEDVVAEDGEAHASEPRRYGRSPGPGRYLSTPWASRGLWDVALFALVLEPKA
mmetsp:Transcript_112395/g.358896  ORF Transcript_112395/g.358896 Transcript_112395/m.358896 type:complete len:278 (+) Transcript_112395:366-1199(+)